MYNLVRINDYLQYADIVYYMVFEDYVRQKRWVGSEKELEHLDLLYMIKESVRWAKEFYADDEELHYLVNYMYSLIGDHITEAANISGVGYTVGVPVLATQTIPGTPTSVPYESDGNESFFIMTELIGRNVFGVTRAGIARTVVTVNTTDTMKIKWTKATGRFDLPTGDVTTAGETFIIQYVE